MRYETSCPRDAETKIIMTEMSVLFIKWKWENKLILWILFCGEMLSHDFRDLRMEISTLPIWMFYGDKSIPRFLLRECGIWNPGESWILAEIECFELDDLRCFGGCRTPYSFFIRFHFGWIKRFFYRRRSRQWWKGTWWKGSRRWRRIRTIDDRIGLILSYKKKW